MSTISFALQLAPGSDAIHRVLNVCRRRQLRVHALTYSADTVTLTLDGDESRVRQIGAWLGGLVDVVGIVGRTASAYEPSLPIDPARTAATTSIGATPPC